MIEQRGIVIPTDGAENQSYFVAGAVCIVGHLQGWMNGHLAMGKELTEQDLFQYVTTLIPALVEHPDLFPQVRKDLSDARSDAVASEMQKRALAALPDKVPLTLVK